MGIVDLENHDPILNLYVENCDPNLDFNRKCEKWDPCPDSERREKVTLLDGIYCISNIIGTFPLEKTFT